MTEVSLNLLRIVDARTLDSDRGAALMPGRVLRDRDGRARRLPRFFYEIESWEMAQKATLAPSFAVWELLNIDLREAEILRRFPRYLPCAATLMAACLEIFRNAVGAPVHIAANGGYRSPSHALSCVASPHNWGTAANIYRIGNEFLDDQEKIERYGAIALRVLPGAWMRPYGHTIGCADDHLHIDFGYVTAIPRDAAGEDESS